MLGLLLVPAVARSQEKPTARLLLDQMAEKYSRLVSYQDDGVVITTYDEETGGRIEKLPFKTSFKRPNLFRFEWTDYFLSKLGKRRVVWSNGKDAFTYWEPDRYEKEKYLGLAIAGATGISGGSAHTVPRLLLADEVSGLSVTDLKGISLLGEEVFEGMPCYHIKGAHPHGEGFYELWIGKSDLLLRRVRQETKDSDSKKVTTEEEIRRNIHVNEPIANALFDYKPPIDLTPPADPKSLEDLTSILDAAPVWTEFKSEAGRFSILMPAKPNYATQTFETGQGRFEHHVFIATAGLLACFVDYADMPKQFGEAKNSDALFDLARDEFLKGAQAKLERETNISMDGHPGREVRMHVYGGAVRLRLFLISGRLYQLSITLVKKEATSEEETIEKFFKSFKATSLAKSIALRL
jgi:outer membrane lipoprotein-sorting protein